MRDEQKESMGSILWFLSVPQDNNQEGNATQQLSL